MILVLSDFYLYLLMYLLAGIAAGFATNFGGSLLQQKIDGEKLDLRKALNNGINGAISSVTTAPKTGNYARDFHCLDQTFRRGKVYSFC